jgi:hypothetical protein
MVRALAEERKLTAAGRSPTGGWCSPAWRASAALIGATVAVIKTFS